MSRPEDEEFADIELDEIDDLWDDDLDDAFDEVSDDSTLSAEHAEAPQEEASAPVEKPKKQKKVKSAAEPNAPKKKIGVVGPLLLLSMLGGAGFLVYKMILNPPAPAVIPTITAQAPEREIVQETQDDIVEPAKNSDLSNLLNSPDIDAEENTGDITNIIDDGSDEVLTPMPDFSDDSALDAEIAPLFDNEVIVDDTLEIEEEDAFNNIENQPDLPFEEDTNEAFLDEEDMLIKTEGVVEEMPPFPESDEDISANDDINEEINISEALDFNIEPVDINDLEIESSIDFDNAPEQNKETVNPLVEEKETVAAEDLTPVKDITEPQEKPIEPPVEEPQKPITEEKPVVAETTVQDTKIMQPTKKPEAPKKATVAPVAPKIAWVIRAAQPGKAVISDAKGTVMQSIEVGDTVSGIGTVKSISKSTGKWVIQGTSGKITQ